MSTELTIRSPEARDLFNNVYLQVKSPFAAERVWEQFSEVDRRELGDDLNEAYYKYRGAVGMWAKVRGVSPQRAVIDIAWEIDLIGKFDYKKLLRRMGESPDDPIGMIEKAVSTGAFVLVESPRRAFWDREEIEVKWDKKTALWEFLWELGIHAKQGEPLDHMAFGEFSTPGALNDRISRLFNKENAPISLLYLIESAGRGTRRLKLPPEEIRIFRNGPHNTLIEFFG